MSLLEAKRTLRHHKTNTLFNQREEYIILLHSLLDQLSDSIHKQRLIKHFENEYYTL